MSLGRLNGLIRGLTESTLTNPMSRKDVLWVLKESASHFEKMPPVVDLEIGPSLTICGDTHGQLFDVLRLFDINGPPSSSNPYLFNGDLVDRGAFGVELCLLVLCYVLLYPSHVTITRGNHESRQMTRHYGFAGETTFKYDTSVLNAFYSVFDALPIAVCLNERVLVLHGGLFADSSATLDDLRRVDRFGEPRGEGLLHDALWSDPDRRFGRRFNSQRGGGLRFGPDVTAKFLEENDLAYVIRSHEVRHEGYSVEHSGKLITIFSAPNYGGMKNKAAFIRFKDNDHLSPEFVQYEGVPPAEIPSIEEIKAAYSRSKL